MRTRSRSRRALVLGVGLVVVSGVWLDGIWLDGVGSRASAQGLESVGGDAPRARAVLPPADIDPDHKVPALRQVVGHDFGERISSHEEALRYVRALADASPFRTRLLRFGETWGGRDMVLLAISSPAHIDRLDEIRAERLRLADPRGAGERELAMLAERAPAVVWLGYSVHGNEASGTDASLALAYRLLADRGDATRALLDELVVLIELCANPDGRDRFVHGHREARGRFADVEPAAWERAGRWASGRLNHYLFDLNRDWFLTTQAESKARVSEMLRQRPHVVVDAHEMGPASSYFFPPAAPPFHSMVLARQNAWIERIGIAHSDRFDELGIAYTTRETFDSFYPGYGEMWPTLSGSIGLLWEQAGARGEAIRREDGTFLSYRQGVAQHYASSVVLLETVARNRGEIVRDGLVSAQESIALAASGEVSDYFLLEGEYPGRARSLAALLEQNGIHVRRVEKPVRVLAREDLRRDAVAEVVPAGSYRVPLAQASSRLARAILDRHSDMGEEFIRRQIERRDRRLDEEIYDVTAWSLPLAFGVRAFATLSASETVDRAFLSGGRSLDPGRVEGGAARVGYLIDPGSPALHRALAAWLRDGLRVHVIEEPFRLGGRRHAHGTLLLRSAENPPDLLARVERVAAETGVVVHATDTGYVDEGAHFGGGAARFVRAPNITLLVDRPTSTNSGHTWFLFDRVVEYPTSRVPVRNAGRIDWKRLDVLIVPDGRYGEQDLDPELVARIRTWVSEGGTLVLVRGAAAWAASEAVGLLPVKAAERVFATREASVDEATAAEAKKNPTPAPRERPIAVPGAFLRAVVEEDSFLTWGLGSSAEIFFRSDILFEPLSRLQGREPVRFVESPDDILTSGFVFPETRELLPGRAYALTIELGRGRLVAFADDPAWRGFSPILQRLLLNAVFFGPAR